MFSVLRDGDTWHRNAQALLGMKIRGRLQTPQPGPQDVQQSRGKSRMLVTHDNPAAEPGYHNPSPSVWLIGYSSEAAVQVEEW